MASGSPSPNPFKPSAGVSPPELIGRQDLLDSWQRALDEGPGSPGRLAIFTGQRGVGKTVMLNEIGDRAQREGWHVINLTATPGLLERLDAEAVRLWRVEEPPAAAKVTGISVAGVGGVSFERSGELSTNVRTTLTNLADALGRRGSGVLVTLDEIHSAPTPELRELAAITQHLMREDRQFALVMAGLPASVSGLLSDGALTFMRRADRHELTAVDVLDVELAYDKTIRDNGRTMEATLVRSAATASRGYPYLIQLIGYHIWNRAHGERIDADSVERGIDDARERLGVLVHATALKDLSDMDRRFLHAMAVDDAESQVADLSRRLAKDRYWVNNYRRRLIAARVVEEAGRGRLRFTIPYMREYLRGEGAP